MQHCHHPSGPLPFHVLGQTRFFFLFISSLVSFLLFLCSPSSPAYYMGHVTSIARGLVISLEVSIQLPRNLYDDLHSWVEPPKIKYTNMVFVCTMQSHNFHAPTQSSRFHTVASMLIYPHQHSILAGARSNVHKQS